MLEELSNSLPLIDFDICLIIEVGRFDEMFMQMVYYCLFLCGSNVPFFKFSVTSKKFTVFRFVYLVILNLINFCALDILFL